MVESLFATAALKINDSPAQVMLQESMKTVP